MYFLETSAKEAENVERLFMEIAAELMEVINNIIYYLINRILSKSIIYFLFIFTASTQQRASKI